MSVVEQTPFNEHVGNGVTSVFGYTFQLLDADDLKVYWDGVLQPTSIYSVSGIGNQAGGDVTFTPGNIPASGVVVLLSREIQLARDTDYQYAGELREATLDEDFNRLWQALQGQRAILNGAVRAPYPETMTPLPAQADRASQFLVFDANGNPQVSAGTGADAGLRADLADTTDPAKGAALVGFLQSGSGAVARNLQLKGRDRASGEDFGAAGDGTSNDGPEFNAAAAARRNIHLGSGRSYSLSGVVLSNSQSINGGEALLNAASGATNVVTLQDFKPSVSDIYFQTGQNASTSLFKITSSRYARIRNVVAVDVGAAAALLLLDDGAGGGANRPTISDFDAEDFTGVGLDMRSSVSELRVTNMLLSGKLDFVAGLGKPRAGSIGWKQITPVVGGIPVGGHQVTNLNCINCDTGMRLEDVQLSKYNSVFLDSCSDYGLNVTGACQETEFTDLFVGTTRGVYVGGSSRVTINGLHTKFNGVVPPWGQPGFYNGTAYDIHVDGTAVLIVSGWRGDKKILVASGARLIVLDGTTWQGRTVGTIGSSATTYLSSWGSTPTEADTVWRAPANGRLLRLMPTSSAAPGASQTFVYTARVNGSDSALTATISGASDFGARDSWAASGGVAVNKGDSVGIKLVTSASAAASRHFCELQFVPD